MIYYRYSLQIHHSISRCCPSIPPQSLHRLEVAAALRLVPNLVVASLLE